MILECNVVKDKFISHIEKIFDYSFTGKISTNIKTEYNIPKNFNIGLIIGASGSGKSTLLNKLGKIKDIKWENKKAIISNFKTKEEAVDRLTAVGLNSIPSWIKPYKVLSTGEKFRANLARLLNSNALIDEYTSVINREVAKATSKSLSKYIRKHDLKNIIFASCHIDIIDWLQPDWIVNMDTKILLPRGYLQYPTIKIKIFRCSHKEWEMFKNHHYLTNKINNSSICYIGLLNNVPVVFSASLSLPGRIPPLYIGDNRKKYRESRLVVLPDYQGMGIGTKFSDSIGEIFIQNNYRYFSKTAHIRIGEYRQKSNLWRKTSTNMKSREKSQKRSKKELWHHLTLDTKRLCYSHEYLGFNNIHRKKYEKGIKVKND